MKLIYTVCTSNYLYQALTLGESIEKTNPDYEFIICLADKIPVLDFEIPYKIIPVESINFPALEDYSTKFITLELACALKPIFALHLLAIYPALEKLIYLDTDIYLYRSLEDVEKNLDEHDIIITPHITKEIPLSERWNEKQYLNAGLYNAGFIAFKRTENTLKFLDWWQTHLNKYGYLDYCKGMGADQLCLNFVPVFYDKVLIDYNPGLNIAYWNFQERELSVKDGSYFVNDINPLVFFHFSGYNPEKPKLVSKHLKLSSNKNQQALKQILQQYRISLIKNHFNYFKGIIPAYGIYVAPPKEKHIVGKLIEKSAWKVINYIENF
ncbi:MULTISPECIES: hypothetical protein [unclassified Arcicella]|uniref:hypothetical protein n=1 Tax=unclassified Arcicella TaxID=2644986 RepID=UPI00285D2A1B|nr:MULTISPECIES: hypothetical protein [unclassified Arcicella]MDR6564296.1 hypothetical protein [Arcicella sp. BE51]MDR6811457.1 hypothetical protein [Arcicella sp. BE140]MDR6825997.1 hypothetical protein [Arcicella sp. BE139]